MNTSTFKELESMLNEILEHRDLETTGSYVWNLLNDAALALRAKIDSLTL